MTIYRGEGGGGNATTDSEIALLTSLQLSAQASATSATASADSAAVSAAAALASELEAEAAELAAENSAVAADVSADAAAIAETNAAASAQLAQDWAIKTPGTVDGLEYSSKYYAQEASSQVASIDTPTIVRTINNQTIGGIKTFSSTIVGSISGNAGTVTNGVYQTALTGSVLVSTGTTGQRDGSPAAGYFRFNTSLAKFEGYNGTAWGAVGGGATGGGGDEVFIENNKNVTVNYTIPGTKNAMTTGPITINDGITVTVSDGARWVIL
jgi:hypothetical protein